MNRETCVSCPGKVLIAGGYLVLEASYTGLVIATASSRFYCVVRPAQTQSETLRIVVKSPQFQGARWAYEWSQSTEGGTCSVSPTGPGSPNIFVQTALEQSYRILLALNGKVPSESIEISLLGDNDFYSQPHGAPPFAKLATTLADVHKTGLGSSAAMVTSLVGALLAFYGVNLDAKRRLFHNVAQYAHSLAQGQIGSGFDVSAAVFGSQKYNRFSPACLPSLSAANQKPAKRLLAALDPEKTLAWRNPKTSGLVQPFDVPPLCAMVLADVDRGSNTPSMVGKVQSWRDANGVEAATLWGEIDDRNTKLAYLFEVLQTFHHRHPTDYASALSAFAQDAVSNPVVLKRYQENDRSGFLLQMLTALHSLQETIVFARSGMRRLGHAASVPIEPPAQTELLDAMSRLPGVIGGGVPGAGGYDAIWLLVTATDPSVIDQLEQALRSYSAAKVRPLSKAARIYGSTTREQSKSDGARLEDLHLVAGLAEALEAVGDV